MFWHHTCIRNSHVELINTHIAVIDLLHYVNQLQSEMQTGGCWIEYVSCNVKVMIDRADLNNVHFMHYSAVFVMRYPLLLMY